MALDIAGEAWTDAPLQVCSVTSFSSLSNKAHGFQSLLPWPSVRKKINTISMVLLGKVFPLNFLVPAQGTTTACAVAVTLPTVHFDSACTRGQAGMLPSVSQMSFQKGQRQQSCTQEDLGQAWYSNQLSALTSMQNPNKNEQQMLAWLRAAGLWVHWNYMFRG